MITLGECAASSESLARSEERGSAASENARRTAINTQFRAASCSSSCCSLTGPGASRTPQKSVENASFYDCGSTADTRVLCPHCSLAMCVSCLRTVASRLRIELSNASQVGATKPLLAQPIMELLKLELASPSALAAFAENGWSGRCPGCYDMQLPVPRAPAIPQAYRDAKPDVAFEGYVWFPIVTQAGDIEMIFEACYRVRDVAGWSDDLRSQIKFRRYEESIHGSNFGIFAPDFFSDETLESAGWIQTDTEAEHTVRRDAMASCQADAKELKQANGTSSRIKIQEYVLVRAIDEETAVFYSRRRGIKVPGSVHNVGSSVVSTINRSRQIGEKLDHREDAPQRLARLTHAQGDQSSTSHRQSGPHGLFSGTLREAAAQLSSPFHVQCGPKTERGTIFVPIVDAASGAVSRCAGVWMGGKGGKADPGGAGALRGTALFLV